MKRSLTHRIAITALAGIIAASGVQASLSADGSKMLKQFDRNADGQITRVEAKEALTQRFARMDANGDGTVTRDERRAIRKERQFKRMDADQNGSVTLQEMEAAMMNRVQSRFSRLDADGNGEVTLAEVQSQANRRAGRGPMTLQDLDARVMRMFDRADLNRDGVITPDEASSMRPDG